MLLYIDQICRNPGQEKPSEQLKALSPLKKLIVEAKIPEDQHRGIAELAVVLCELISAGEMATLLPVLVPGVNDGNDEAALGTAMALKGLLNGRANEIGDNVAKLLDVILA